LNPGFRKREKVESPKKSLKLTPASLSLVKGLVNVGGGSFAVAFGETLGACMRRHSCSNGCGRSSV